MGSIKKSNCPVPNSRCGEAGASTSSGQGGKEALLGKKGGLLITCPRPQRLPRAQPAPQALPSAGRPSSQRLQLLCPPGRPASGAPQAGTGTPSQRACRQVFIEGICLKRCLLKESAAGACRLGIGTPSQRACRAFLPQQYNQQHRPQLCCSWSCCHCIHH